MITLDFSSAGVKLALKEFFTSLLKTALAAAIGYVILRLDGLHVSSYIDPMYAALAAAGIATLRALLTSLSKWATTTPTVDNAVVGGLQ
jgi:hypothetical protein